MSAREPFTAEERALAERLARLDAHAQPSAELDARILAAARAATVASAPPQPYRRARWPVAAGLAASAVLAVGIAWQLRPLQETPAIVEQAQPSASLVGSADAGAQDAPPPEAAASDTFAEETASPPPAQLAEPPAAASPEPSRPRQETAAPRPVPAAPRQARAVPPPAPAEPAAVAPAQRARGETAPAAFHPPSPPAPPAPAAPAPALTVSAPASQAAAGRALDADTAEQASPAKATLDARDLEAARRAQTQQRALQQQERRANAARRAAPAEEPAQDRAAFAPSPIQRTDLQLPVPEDAKLSSDDWIERIRLRRDLGDRASAAASLRLYVQEHPFRKVPEDLQALLTE